MHDIIGTSGFFAPTITRRPMPQARPIAPTSPDMLEAFFGTMDKSCSCGFPGIKKMKLDVVESDDAYTISADLPGVDKNDVDITIEDDVLTISYENKEETSSGDAEPDKAEEKTETEKPEDKGEVEAPAEPKWLIRERRYCSMKRALTLPNADEEATTAKMENGVLVITVPKKEEVQTSKKIMID